MAFGGKLDSNSFEREKSTALATASLTSSRTNYPRFACLGLVTNFYPVLVTRRGRFGASQVLTMQPCEQRFLTCMAFSVYEVVRVAFQSSSDKRLTDDANEFVNAKSHSKQKPLLAVYDDAKGLAQQINRSTGYYRRVSNNVL